MSYLLIKFIYIILFVIVFYRYKLKYILYKKYTRYIKDILFINGYDRKKDVLHYKYRILIQIEQLNANFFESDEYFFFNFEPNIVSNYRVIIFSGCPWTEKVEEAIILAKNLNKKILFDMDDFSIIKKYNNKFSFINYFSLNEKEIFNETFKEIGKFFKFSDGVITINEYLSNKIKNYISTVFINRNSVNEEMMKLSKSAIIKKNNMKLNKNFIIGYFCDYVKFDSDFEVIKNALIKILTEFKNVILLLVGKFTLPNFLKEFSSQIIYKKFFNLKKLSEIIANFDLNIAPLGNNIFNNIKNENTWVLASLVKVPTIASNYGIFKQIIKQNITGILCSKENDWYLSLKELIYNEQYRKYLGENAYKYCEIKYNALYNSNKIGNFITIIKTFYSK